jgi:MarR family 2-MHQ and catechol resistance regulon transcriptional repressor
MEHEMTMTTAAPTTAHQPAELAWTLAQVQGAVQTGITHALRRYGLSHAMLQAMIRLRQAPKRRLRMTDLADNMAYSRSGITRLIDRLVDFGLVVREHCTDDRRSLEAALTPEGERTLALALPNYLAALDSLLTSRLSPEQLDIAMGSLTALHDAVAGFAPAEGGQIKAA